jgi:ankyrin repeat protein
MKKFLGIFLVPIISICCFADLNDDLVEAVIDGNLIEVQRLIDVVKLLLSYEADVNLKGGPNITPLYKATICGYDEIKELLIEAGAEEY